MATSSGEMMEEPCRNSTSSSASSKSLTQPFHRVADRVQHWNRAIPEAGYITLGTIRYGVRLSQVHPLNGMNGATSGTPAGPAPLASSVEKLSSGTNSTPSADSSSISSTENGSHTISNISNQVPDSNSCTNLNSCCCLGSTAIVMPWNTNYARTKLPTVINNSYTTAKNRTLPTSSSSSSQSRQKHLPLLSLAVSSSSHPSGEVYPPPSTITPNSTTSQLRSGDDRQIIMAANSTASVSPLSSTQISTAPASSNGVEMLAASSTQSNNMSKKSSLPPSQPPPPPPLPPPPKSTSKSSLPPPSAGNASSRSRNRRKCECSCCRRSVTCSPGCCKLNSSSADSVSVEYCREIITPVPASSASSICCYTIANTSKSISKSSNRHNQKRIPRTVIQQQQNNSNNFALTPTANSGGPPIPPPKVCKNPSSTEDQSIDPINFRRKIQQFEARNQIEQYLLNGNTGCCSNGSKCTRLNCFTKDPCSGHQSSLRSPIDRCSGGSVDSSGGHLTPNGSSTGECCAIIRKFGVGDLHSNKDQKCLGSENIKLQKLNGQQNHNNKNNTNNNPLISHNANLKNCHKDSGIRLKSFSDPSPAGSSSSAAAVAAAVVVIRKLTPKLTRKKLHHHVRGESEDRLIVDENDNCNKETECSKCPVNLSGDQILNDDDSDIGFIDSSTGDDGDIVSSLSDFDLIGSGQSIDKTTNDENLTCELINDSNLLNIEKNNNLNSELRKSCEKGDSIKIGDSFFVKNFNNNSVCDFQNSFCEKSHIASSGISPDHLNCFISKNSCGNDANELKCKNSGLNANLNSNCGKNSLNKDSENINNGDPANQCRLPQKVSSGIVSALPATVTPSTSIPKGSYPIPRTLYPSDSFGYFTKHLINSSSSSPEQLISMEKRRNTLDRLQRLGFGRRSSPSPTQDQKSSSTNSGSKKSSDKSERLRELTELLRGNRSSPTPPPVPPPRKPRHAHSVEKPPDKSSVPALTDRVDSEDIIHMDAEEEHHIPDVVKRKSDDIPQKTEDRNSVGPSSPATSATSQQSKGSLYQTLRPNTSVSNLENLIMSRDYRDMSKSPPSLPINEEDLFTKLARAESRTIVGSYMQKTIPFRSASFSQIDYSSGKYIRSALGSFRDKLRKDKEPSVVNNANLTLPRKKDDLRSSSPRLHQSFDEANRDILLKKSELSINLKYEAENERISLEEIVNPPDVILEEEPSTLEADRQESIAETSSESQTGSDESGRESNMDSPLSDDATNINSSSSTVVDPLAVNYVDASEPTLGTLTEEEIPMESPPENFHQTATTCLIPVPVYECAVKEWEIEHPNEQWIDVAQDEVGMSPEIFEMGFKVEPEVLSSPEVPSSIDPVPTISVSQDSLSTTDEKSSEEKLCEFPEVKKRNSNNDEQKITDKIDIQSNRGVNVDEKRRIDKSRRRKGMYIQWPAIDRHGNMGSSDWSTETDIQTPDDFQDKDSGIDLTKVDFAAIKAKIDHNSRNVDPGILFLSCKTPDEIRTPGSQYSYDPSTPESEYNRPIWPKLATRRSSLTCQSSEEKDDMPSTASPGTRSHRNLSYLRSDSISDNESDRTPPSSSRDRASPSPAPGDQDFKRYSKRPLRGPYGQMLEAEMKKPGKLHYDEILEDLKNAESLNSLSPPIRVRGAPGNHSFDDTHSSSPQTKSSASRLKKLSPGSLGSTGSSGSAYLPLPMHTRAASTPSQIENTTTTASISSLNPQHKRYQSSLDNAHLDSVRNSKDGAKKFSLDSNRDRSPKRASSEIVDNSLINSKHHPKRSLSTASADKHQKRSLDEMRLSSRTPSERNVFGTSNSSDHHQQYQHQGKAGSGGGSHLLPTPELLAQLLKGSSERLVSEQRQQMFADTRTHVVQEIFRNEQSYVDSLQTVVVKYLNILKTPEYAGMIDSKTVDEIFFMVPEILNIHEQFLSEMKARLDIWDSQQQVGDAFIETFSKTEVLETYTLFVNNCNRAKDAIKTTSQTRPSFARFLESNAREHKGKLSLDNLLIKPVQKFPNYEMLFTRLIKHTDEDHPDQKPLQDVLKLVHDILMHINCKEKEILENGQREATLRELEGIIEGINELVKPERQFLLFELVTVPFGQGARKERGLFLFSDLLVITSIKRRSGTIRKPNPIVCPGSIVSTLDTNKYKYISKINLTKLEIVKNENVRKIMNEIDQLSDDCNKLQQISEIASGLRYPHLTLEETIRELHREVQRQLNDRQSNDTQLNVLEVVSNSPNDSQSFTFAFSKPEKRSQWEETINDAKQKLVALLERHLVPEFLSSIPIRKTRAGLQFTCASPTLSNQKDVWVCNSDGYVGQVCVLSLVPEPTVTSCNGVCNARILCVASVPANHEPSSLDGTAATSPRSSRNSNSSNYHSIATNSSDKQKSSSKSDTTIASEIQLDSNSSNSDDSELESSNTERVPSPTSMTNLHHQNQDSSSDDPDGQQSTMWLGTEDGCIHVYNCTDNIRIKKNKIKIQHVTAVYSILYLDNRVFVALANGDICVYLRDSTGWNTSSPHCIPIGTVTSPVTKLLNVHGKLWCSIQGIIKVLDTKTLQVENQIQISSDSKPITNMAVSQNNVWMSIQNSANIKCFHSISHEQLYEVNLSLAVNRMLNNCDDIIRQHKAACLRVTSLLACKDLLWIGTSAGVLLTMPASGIPKGQNNSVTPAITGISQGHTGHVRFLTFVETEKSSNGSNGNSDDPSTYSLSTKNNRNSHSKSKSEASSNTVLVISGGDGYEDFRTNTMSEVAGREDSTNHLLLWQM